VARLLGFQVYGQNELPLGANYVADIARLAQQRGIAVETIFDVGANIGYTVLPFANSFPRATIWAFEPVAANFANLKWNTERLPRVNTFQLALGATPSVERMYLKAGPTLHSLTEGVNLPDPTRARVETVTVETIDQFGRDHKIEKIDILKTDTEGYDLEVIKGAERYLDAGNITFILSESSFRGADKRWTEFARLWSYLEPKGFDFFGLYDVMRSPAQQLTYCNTLFVKKEVVSMSV
jgi:FkbM family methyltransferase